MEPYKNIVYGGDVHAGGDVHIGDIYYHIEEDFQHSILFLKLEKTETHHYSALLSLKFRHAKLAGKGVSLFHQHIEQLGEARFKELLANLQKT